MKRDSVTRFAMCATVWAMACAAQAADTITLKPEVYVKGPEVCIGDLAVVRGANAATLSAIPVTVAPEPGASKRIDSALLETRVKTAGVSQDAVKIGGAPSVVARTLSLEVTGEMIAEDLRAFILNTMPWAPENADIEVTPPQETVITPEGDLSLDWKPASSYRYAGPGTFRGELRVDGKTYRILACQADIKPREEIVVAAVDIPSGKMISASDLVLEARPLGQANAGVFRSVNEAVGKVAQNSLTVGQPLSPRNVQAPLVVKRNQIVRVEARAGGLIVASRAKAMGDGRTGEAVMCQNPESKEQFSGTVQPDGTVSVP